MTTPMRQQYLSIKSQHPDCILLFRLGDFYETFDDDAKTVARVCNVVLTSRPVGNDQRVPLAGVPYHAVDYYVAKLVEAGFRVAIAEQITEPGKGLVEREVRRVVTKGTIVEPKMLDERRNNYLMAVTMGGRGLAAGVAYCDITTGEFAAAHLGGATSQEVEQRIGEELSRLQPSELIPVDWQPDASSVHNLVNLLHPAISHVEAWQVEPETASATLRRHFGVSTLDGFGLHGKPEAVRAAAAVLAYVQQMQPSRVEPALSPPHLHRRRVHDAGRGDAAQPGTHRDHARRRSQGQPAGRAGCHLDAHGQPPAAPVDQPAAARRVRHQPPFGCGAAILRQHGAAAGSARDTETGRRPGALDQSYCAGRGSARDLVGMRDVLRQIPALSARLTGDALLPDLPLCPEVLALLEAAIADDPPATLATIGFIRPGFDAELDNLVDRSRGAKDWIANLEQVERQRLDIKSLKVGYNKVFGYYIEVTSSHLAKVPPEYIRKQTIANGERFITPDLKEYETLVLNADERRLEIEQHLFKEICAQIAAHGARLLQLAQGLAELDVFTALAEVALLRRYVRPAVDDGPAIQIDGGRHPVVELMLTDDPFVPNDTRLVPAAAIQIITGPNMSGKSTALRQVALITLMTQIGSFVPADSAQIGVVDRIFTRLGASDEIHRGQSTFMVEMVETANILNHATQRSLLVLDEIGRGTSTYDGLAIAWAVIEYIHNHPKLRAKTLFATHYHELTELAERLPHVVNYNVAVDDSGNGEDVIFLHRIIPGKADRSYGVHVARLAGLPQAVVARAEEILQDLERSGAAGPRQLYEAESPRRALKPAAMQVSLFAEVHPVVEALRKLDVNGLTPLDALNRLYELQKLAM